ncbi:MAG: DegT/DnrJ/EryC1/StrS family aminotransferase [candidate division KSB1 bacterium]|nr:DegT/DnrJ/EryC1/StrS family aminotransferase [candidate division KSB1 bacterium]MDQ7062751.1 DegT/DnrJ/EryC1/StrS family aminotransferase [candidate division KSB1 bacterium]
MKLAIRGGEPVRKRPFPDWPIWNDTERRGLNRVLESGKWGSLQGQEVRQFEREFAKYQGAEFGIAVTSGSAALEVSLRAVGIEAYDEVLIPAYTFVATATAVLVNAAIPVFVDIDLETYNMSTTSLEQALTPSTRAIMPVHFAGRPANMDEIEQFARDHNLYIIEDAAQGWGAQWRGQGVGTFGDFGCFSFQSSKNISSGEGGIILTNDEELARMASSYMNCGRVEGAIWYAHYHLGSNYRMTEFQAAVLSGQLSRYDQQLEHRQQNMALLDNALQALEGVQPLTGDARITRHAGHIYIFRYNAEAFDMLSKEGFVSALQAEGIPCSGGYSLPLYKQPIFRNQSYGPFTKILREKARYENVNLPNTEKACFEEAIWLPQRVLLGSVEDMRDIVRAIEKIYDNRHELI